MPLDAVGVPAGDTMPMDPICHPHTGIETFRSIRGLVAVWGLHLPAKIKRHNMFGILSVKRRLPVARGRWLPSWQQPCSVRPLAMTAGIWDEGNIENGQALFNANCASCHLVTNEVLAAPGLAGIADRWGSSDEILVQWIQNPQAAAATGDGYIKSLGRPLCRHLRMDDRAGGECRRRQGHHGLRPESAGRGGHSRHRNGLSDHLRCQ